MREKEILDRTLPHLDHADNPRQTTHAVGVLKAVSLGKQYPGWVIFKMKLKLTFKSSEPLQVKDAVLFAARDKDRLIDVLQIDTYEPPTTQVSRYFLLLD